VVESPQADPPVGKVMQDSEAAAAAAGSLRTRALARVEIRSTELKIVWYFILLKRSRRSLVWSSGGRSLQSCSVDNLQGRCDSFGLGMVDVRVAKVRWSDGKEVGWHFLNTIILTCLLSCSKYNGLFPLPLGLTKDISRFTASDSKRF